MNPALLLPALLPVLAIQPAATPTPAPNAPVVITLTTPATDRLISPYIYGTCQDLPHMERLTFIRNGGNRMTAYNWENNASNAGADWQHQSDDFMGKSNVAGQTMLDFVTPVLARGQTAVVTIPMAGYVAADKLGNGDVNKTPDYLNARFKKNRPSKGKPFAYPPDTTDDFVYQDEFVHWLESQFPKAQRKGQIWYALDNEPDIWNGTHIRIQPHKLTYADLLERTISWSTAIKAQAPDAMVFGFVSYGFNGYISLQDAPDAKDRNFIDFFLTETAKADKAAGHRLVDVLDLHWYPETQGGGKRIPDADPKGSEPATVAARVQAPRHMYDPTFRETSWIDSKLNAPIDLLHRVQKQIDAHNPGTKLAFTEYNYGGTDHISGAIAEADVLGAFGANGVFAASLWGLAGQNTYVSAAFDLYRNYDGKGATFGNHLITTTSSNLAAVSAWASTNDAGQLTLILINRATTETPITLTGTPLKSLTSAHLYQLTSASPTVTPAPDINPTHPLTLPPMSITLLATPK